MMKNEYAEMAKMEEVYWWHRGRIKIVQKQLDINTSSTDNDILNIGCGTGGTVGLLSRYGEVYNVDVSEEAINFCKQKGLRNVRGYNGKRLPYKDKRFDLVIALDVLEHIELDYEALVEWLRVLKPGGKLVMTVPAYQWLWSEHDERLHHQRRYTASQVHMLVSRSGYVMKKRSYAIVFSFPLIVLHRLLSSITGRKRESSYVMLPGAINTLFTWLLYLEAWMLRYLNFPFGTSIVVVAEKAQNG